MRYVMLKRHMLISLIWIAVLTFSALPALAEMIVDTAWVRRYSQPGDSVQVQAVAAAIVVDSSSNIYVTGGSHGIGTHHDYVTIKYDALGSELWVKGYNGPGNFWDWANAIALDGSGNAHVAGRSVGVGTDEDYATIKYDPSGNEVWVKRYNGPGNGYDEAYDIAVDSSGNVYVTGASDGNGTVWDYATIKYYPNGDAAWIRRYNGLGNGYDEACDIAVDSSGNVYVTGTSDGNGAVRNYATIKYYPDGDTAWIRRYSGPGNSNNKAQALAVDNSGNVYVAGYSWSIETRADYVTIKYNPNGDTIWIRRYNGPGNDWDAALAIAVDSPGNVCVTGASWASATDYDYATIKYHLNGDTAWVRRYDGGAGLEDVANDIAVDASGNVYVTGFSLAIATFADYATVKYGPDGDTGWVTRYNGPGNHDDGASAIVVDASSNVYVTGWSQVSGTEYDYGTIKYFQALRGDTNRDGEIDIADVVYLAEYLFVAGPAPEPLEAGDANCDGEVDLADAVYIINYLFIGGPPPSC